MDHWRQRHWRAHILHLACANDVGPCFEAPPGTRLRLLTRRALRVPTPLAGSWRELWAFGRHQGQLVRLYRPRLWWCASLIATADFLARIALAWDLLAANSADVRSETASQHAAANSGAYDIVCAFHVAEHTSEPGRFVAEMARCLRPGGRLFLAVPGWPSAMTDIPNFAPNGPPHHLSWWSKSALQALAESLGLIVETVEVLPPSPDMGILYWMAWASPKLTSERFFRDAWGCHGSLVWSWLAARVCNSLFRIPAGVKSFELLLIARTPV